MPVTERGLNRATLARQLLLRREPLDAVAAVRRVVALQAQHPASPYVALWNRVAAFDPAALDAAFASGAVVKSNPVRMTLHAVAADDFAPFREATEPSLRAAKLSDRYRVSGLTVADADALVPELLAYAAEPRTAAECEAWLGSRVGDAARPGAWWGLRQYAPLLRAPTGPPWSFGAAVSYVAPRDRPRLADPAVADASLGVLALRYLAAFGPATAADLALFAQVQRARAGQALAALGDAVVRVDGPGRAALYDVPGAPLPDEAEPAPPRLLGMWDNTLLAYTDRSRVIPPEYRALVTRSNGDVLPTLLVDGWVVGVWRAVEDGIEATAFHALPDGAWDGLAAEAASLGGLLARDPLVYRRYDHWWRGLPAAAVRLLST